MAYVPKQEILDKYADLLVNFALNTYKGVKKGEVVFLQVPECAKPMLVSLRRSVLKAGAHPIISYYPDDISKEFFELANEEQLKFFPDKFLKGKAEQADHALNIIATTNPQELKGIPPNKIMTKAKSMKPYKEWLEEKENKGRFTWTLALYGTEAMAKEANLSLEEYWDEIIKACYLDEEDPVAKWKEIVNEIERVKDSLNALGIEKLHVESEDTDLWVKIGDNREWMGGSGRNIPSFEVFISPDWRGTEGHIQFNQPVYIYDVLVKDVYLEFKDGVVVKATASEGEEVLKEMIKAEGADKVGEYSLTDGRLSRITRFMAETLFDENVGGEQGNTHLALGSAYKDSYPGDPSTISKEQWDEMGYNDSAIHTDIVSTMKRKVTAILKSGKEKVIYEDGKFKI